MNYFEHENAEALKKQAYKYDSSKTVEVSFELRAGGMPDKTKQPQEYDAWTKDTRNFKVLVNFENVPMQTVLQQATKPIIIRLQNEIRSSFNELEKENYVFIDAGNMASTRKSSKPKSLNEMTEEELKAQLEKIQALLGTK